MLISTEDKPGKIIAQINIPKGSDWNIVKKTVTPLPAGVKNLVVKLKGGGNVEVDWVSFE